MPTPTVTVSTSEGEGINPLIMRKKKEKFS
jgi:hypothetical protein